VVLPWVGCPGMPVLGLCLAGLATAHGYARSLPQAWSRQRPSRLGATAARSRLWRVHHVPEVASLQCADDIACGRGLGATCGGGGAWQACALRCRRAGRRGSGRGSRLAGRLRSSRGLHRAGLGCWTRGRPAIRPVLEASWTRSSALRSPYGLRAARVRRGGAGVRSRAWQGSRWRVELALGMRRPAVALPGSSSRPASCRGPSWPWRRPRSRPASWHRAPGCDGSCQGR
jgi:hypothetical protein